MDQTPNCRPAARLVRGVPVSDGAGVKLNRLIGTPQLDQVDPFLMLDEFRSDDAADYIAGFPEHPHRGFETVTYMLAGRMRHGDNKGHSRPSRCRQRAVDDGGTRHRPFRNAGAGRRLDVGLPALGQFAGQGQDDGAALSGDSAGPNSHRAIAGRRVREGDRGRGRRCRRPDFRDRQRPDLFGCDAAGRTGNCPCRCRRVTVFFSTPSSATSRSASQQRRSPGAIWPFSARATPLGYPPPEPRHACCWSPGGR